MNKSYQVLPTGETWSQSRKLTNRAKIWSFLHARQHASNTFPSRTRRISCLVRDELLPHQLLSGPFRTELGMLPRSQSLPWFITFLSEIDPV